MEVLNKEYLIENNISDYSQLPCKVLQFGEGNFLRAFVDWMINECNSKELFNGSIKVVQPIARGMVDLLNKQDGLYTLLARGVQDGKVIEDKHLITSINECINPYENWSKAQEAVKQPELRFIFSNTTEAGIVYEEERYTPNSVQNTYPAKLTSLLYDRYKEYNGDISKGLIVIPCELIENNGGSLKKCVLQYASDWNLDSGFTAWINSANHFLSTLVDRIVPGYPSEEASSIQQQFGYEDNLINTSEVFHLFVIEGSKELSKELPFDEAGLNVVWTDDLAKYRTQKVRFLNGAHTSNVLAAYLSGIDTVKEMMDSELFGSIVKNIVFDEILKSLDLDKNTMQSYAESVLERFMNPFIKHELISISLNSVSKWKVRVLPSLLDYYKKYNELPIGIAFSLAALIVFYRIEKTGSQYFGSRENNKYEVKDDAYVLEFFEELWRTEGNYHKLVNKVLKNKIFWGIDLTELDGLSEYLVNAMSEIVELGIVEAAMRIK